MNANLPVGEHAAILIAEDSPTQAQRLQYILQKQGYRVTHATNGRLALDAARQHAPALIISDVVMPEMDGYELCRQVKADPRLAAVPVILVTTLSDPGDVIRGLECRADNFILKPYEEEHLVSRVQFVLMNRLLRQQDHVGLAVEIFFNGQQHRISADRLQILNLLLSTYEAAIQRNKDLTRAQEELVVRAAVLAERDRRLQEAQTFLENLVAGSPSIIFRLEPRADAWIVTYVSPNIGWILGYQSEEVVGAPTFFQDLFHPAEFETNRLAFFAALDGMTAQLEQEYCWRLKDGVYRWFFTVTRVEYGEDGRPIALLCHALDISDRKRAEENARRAEIFLESVIENVPLSISVKDARDFRYRRMNRAFEDLVGHSRAELLGKTLQDFLTPQEAAFYSERERHAVNEQTMVAVDEAELRTAARGVRLVRSQMLPIVNETGVPQHVLTVAEDITDRKADERALAAAKAEAERANRAKSDFLSRMSHDLRTPLNAILGFAQLLATEDLSADQHDSIRHIRSGGAHLLALINEVLDLARIESGHLSLSPEPVAISEIVHHVAALVRPLAAQRGISFDDDAVATCGNHHVLADRQRLTQILMNLLANAVKYNRDGGRVGVSCEGVPEGRIRIKVSDTGAGIPPEKVALLFQPFERLGAEQTATEGTGLGLALSKALAEAMGGTLGVESEVDRGSTFWVELAHSEAPGVVVTPLRANPQAADQGTGVTGTVLYIEDNVSNQRLMERVLARRPGVRLMVARNGEEGLDLARSERPDLVLLDLHLPDMHGDEVLRRLWEDPGTRAIPVAMLSADASPAQAKRLLAAGASAYLTKPLDLGQVLQLIDERLAGASGAGG